MSSLCLPRTDVTMYRATENSRPPACTTQYNTVQYNRVKYSTVQCNKYYIIQYTTVH